jgi:hypothetical protein
MRTHTATAALLAACAFAVSACGSDGDAEGAAGTSDGRTKNQEALLEYAQCMREHGVDMPDPEFDGGRVMQRGPGENVDPATQREAEEACRDIREEVEPPELSEEDQEEFREAALAHARCMREQGIENFPDPTFGEGGRVEMRIDRSSGIDPEDPEFQEAQEACQDELPTPEEQSQ